MRFRKMQKVALFLCFSMILFSCGTSQKSTDLSGNTSGNLANGGILVGDGDTIYFNHFGDQNKLYKMDQSGDGLMAVSDEIAYSLNISGDLLYFLSGTEDNAIVTMKKDGSERSVLSDEKALSLQCSGEFLYFISMGEETDPEKTYTLHRMKRSGEEVTRILDDKIQQFFVSGNRLYYIRQEDRSLYVSDQDGKDPVKLHDGSVINFILYEDKLYFVDGSEEKNQLFVMERDGKDLKRLTEEKLSSFHISNDVIYYGNTTEKASMLELKKMSLDGSSKEVLEEIPVISILSHDSWLCLLSMDFSSFSIKETLRDTASEKEMVFEYVNPPAESALAVYDAGAEVTVDQLKVKVQDVYVTNILKNEDPNYESTIFDSVTDGTFVFLTINAENLGEEPLELYETLGHILDINEAYPSIYWYTFYEVDEELLGGDKKYVMPESFLQTMVLQPKESKTLQLYAELHDAGNPIYLYIKDPVNPNSTHALEVNLPEYVRVHSFESALKLMEETFPGNEIILQNGIGFLKPGTEEEAMFYVFEVRNKELSSPEYYFVERDTGEIYTGEPDPSFPDFTGVPKELWQKP